MAKIKIQDLPKDMKISKDELKRIKGGAYEFYLDATLKKGSSPLDISDVLAKKINVIDSLKL